LKKCFAGGVGVASCARGFSRRERLVEGLDAAVLAGKAGRRLVAMVFSISGAPGTALRPQEPSFAGLLTRAHRSGCLSLTKPPCGSPQVGRPPLSCPVGCPDAAISVSRGMTPAQDNVEHLFQAMLAELDAALHGASS